jgi:nitrogen-specific signal transduction histidine kinase
MERDIFFDFLNEMTPPPPKPTVNREKPDLPNPKENIIPNERVAFLLFPFFMELIDQFKDTLNNLRNFARIFQEKYGEKEFATYLKRVITEDIKKIELVQNSLLNYIRINNPITKTNTVNALIEEELKKYHIELEEKKIKLFKTLEKDLPETVVPDDQLRYIFSCILQYVMALIPINGSLGLYTKYSFLRREIDGDQEGRFIEIIMVFTGYKRPMEQLGPSLGISARQKERILDLALRLVDEIVQRNHGLMKFEEDEKKTKTIVSLRFPVERRKVVYYQQPGELASNLHEFKSTFEKLSSLEEMRKGG